MGDRLLTGKPPQCRIRHPGLLSLRPLSVVRLERVPGESWERKQAHRVIHQPVSVVSQCGAGAWLNGLASGDQRRLTGSGSASEACSRRCAIQIHRYFPSIIYLSKTSKHINRANQFTLIQKARHLKIR